MNEILHMVYSHQTITHIAVHEAACTNIRYQEGLLFTTAPDVRILILSRQYHSDRSSSSILIFRPPLTPTSVLVLARLQDSVAANVNRPIDTGQAGN